MFSLNGNGQHHHHHHSQCAQWVNLFMRGRTLSVLIISLSIGRQHGWQTGEAAPPVPLRAPACTWRRRVQLLAVACWLRCPGAAEPLIRSTAPPPHLIARTYPPACAHAHARTAQALLSAQHLPVLARPYAHHSAAAAAARAPARVHASFAHSCSRLQGAPWGAAPSKAITALLRQYVRACLQQRQRMAAAPPAPPPHASRLRGSAPAGASSATAGAGAAARPRGRAALPSAGGAAAAAAPVVSAAEHGSRDAGPVAVPLLPCATQALAEVYAGGGAGHLGEVLDLCAYEEAALVDEESEAAAAAAEGGPEVLAAALQGEIAGMQWCLQAERSGRCLRCCWCAHV